ncbi:MAG TPA: hypothetical protein VJC37_03150 [Planctomycetota bacterium]|nr:hypothetical protein [Planctomycetota bacterium]
MKKALVMMALAIACLIGCKDKNAQNALCASAKPCGSICAGPAALLPEEAAIASECDKVMDALAKNNVLDAFSYMEKIFPLPGEEFAELREKTAKMLDSTLTRYGKIIGYERVAVTKKSDSILASTYILKMENCALRWRFVFYKPNDKWIITDMRWDNNLGEDW